MKNILIIISSVIFLSSCFNSTEDKLEIESINNNKELARIIARLEAEGKLPGGLDRTDSLTGIDENNDKIRDDIEKYINAQYPDNIPEARQAAKVLQSSLLTNINNLEAIKEVVYQMDRALGCLINVRKIKNSRIINELEALTTNTKKRLVAYIKFNDATDGVFVPSAEGELCDK